MEHSNDYKHRRAEHFEQTFLLGLLIMFCGGLWWLFARIYKNWKGKK